MREITITNISQEMIDKNFISVFTNELLYVYVNTYNTYYNSDKQQLELFVVDGNKQLSNEDFNKLVDEAKKQAYIRILSYTTI